MMLIEAGEALVSKDAPSQMQEEQQNLTLFSQSLCVIGSRSLSSLLGGVRLLVTLRLHVR